ncbi:hypothetical protein ABZ703_19875 [Streptomyces massasporeus]
MIARDFCGLLLKPCMNSHTGKTPWATGALVTGEPPGVPVAG